MRYCAHVSMGSITLTEGTVCTGLMSAWLNLAGSKYGHTVPSSTNTAQTIGELFAQYWGELQPNM